MANSLQVMNKRLVLLNPKFSNNGGPARGRTAPEGQGRQKLDNGYGEGDNNEQNQLEEEFP